MDLQVLVTISAEPDKSEISHLASFATHTTECWRRQILIVRMSCDTLFATPPSLIWYRMELISPQSHGSPVTRLFQWLPITPTRTVNIFRRRWISLKTGTRILPEFLARLHRNYKRPNLDAAKGVGASALTLHFTELVDNE